MEFILLGSWYENPWVAGGLLISLSVALTLLLYLFDYLKKRNKR